MRSQLQGCNSEGLCHLRPGVLGSRPGCERPGATGVGQAPQSIWARPSTSPCMPHTLEPPPSLVLQQSKNKWGIILEAAILPEQATAEGLLAARVQGAGSDGELTRWRSDGEEPSGRSEASPPSLPFFSGDHPSSFSPLFPPPAAGRWWDPEPCRATSRVETRG